MFKQGSSGWLRERAVELENVLPGVKEIVVSESPGNAVLRVKFAWWAWLTLGILHVMIKQAVRLAIAPWMAAGIRLRVR